MTITPTSLSANNNSAGGVTSFAATLSAEPAAGSTVYAFYLARHGTLQPTTPAVTGGMPTWTLIGTGVYYDQSGSTSRSFLFEGTGTPSGTTVTFDHGAEVHHAAAWNIIQYTSDAGTVAIANSGAQFVESPSGDVAVSTLEVTLPGAPTGAVVMCVSKASVGEGTPEAGYTSLATTSAAGNLGSTHTTYWDEAGADQTPSISGLGPNKTGMVAFELEEGAGGEPPQFARPDADLHVDTGWVNEAAASTNLFQSIDEATASDADFVRSPDTPTSSVYVCSLSAVTDPGVHTDHTLRYRYDKEDVSGTPTINLVVELRQGYVSEGTPGTLIASATHNGVTDAFADGTLTLTTGEAGNITDYADLSVRFVATQA